MALTPLALTRDSGGYHRLVGFSNRRHHDLTSASRSFHIVYALGEWSFRTLSKTAGQLRNKTVLGFDSARVARALLEHKGAVAVTMSRADGAWHVEGAEGKKPKEPVIGSFLEDLQASCVAPTSSRSPQRISAPTASTPWISCDAHRQGRPADRYGARGQARRQVLRHARRHTDGFEARDYMYARLDKQQKDFVEDPGATTTTLPAVPEPGAEDLGGAEEDAAD